ncbi:MAG: hypothetical protein ACLFVP_03370 [Candidatus Bathyarchaeia archaeon]
MAGEDSRPYYLRQPWDILFKEGKLDKISPWSIDLVYLLQTLLEEMEKAGIDFRIAGTAINSSVLIYSKKAELLLKMEEPPEHEEDGSDVYIPPPVPLPFRFEFTTTSVNDLIEALEKALEEEGKRVEQPKLPTLPVPIPEILDLEQYLLRVETEADSLLQEIKNRYRVGERFGFHELTRGKSWIEVVQIFMMLLFMAQRVELDIFQDEETGQIEVVLLGEEKIDL